MRIWSTPHPIFDALHREFNFVVDLCADPENAKLPRFLRRQTSLYEHWGGEGVAFLNPPFGREIEKWTEKAWLTSEEGRIIVGIVPGRTNPPWWHEHVMKAAEIRFMPKKQRFDSPDDYRGVPSWGVVVVVWYPTSAPYFMSRENFYHTQRFPICTSWSAVAT
jgi:phage N-6-adenine-methyltransferase